MRKLPEAKYNQKRKAWEAKGINPTTRKRRSFYASSKQAAEEAARASLGLTDQTTLFGFYSTVYLPTLAGANASLNWKNQIAWAMDNHILPRFGSTPLTQITRADAQEFFNRITLLPSSRRRIKIVWSCVLNLAVQDEAIARNPISAVRLPRPGRSKKKALTPEQLWTLLQAAKPIIRNFILEAGFCGLCKGEALATDQAHSLDGSLLVIDRQVILDKGEKVVPILKAHARYRRIPLPAPMKDMLFPPGQIIGWVCADTIGGRLGYKNVTRELAAACIAAGVPIVSPHELRHTFTSILENEVEAPRPVVQDLIGHARGEMTDVYSHTRTAVLAKWMGKFWDHVSTSVKTINCLQDEEKTGSA